MLQYFTVCCSVLQCVAVCCSVLQCVAVLQSVGYTRGAENHCCSVFQCAYGRMLQPMTTLQHTAAKHCNRLQHTATHCTRCNTLKYAATYCNTPFEPWAEAREAVNSSTLASRFSASPYLRCSVLQSVAVCCSVLQSVAECCRVLQCVAVCCSQLKHFG